MYLEDVDRAITTVLSDNNDNYSAIRECYQILEAWMLRRLERPCLAKELGAASRLTIALGF